MDIFHVKYNNEYEGYELNHYNGRVDKLNRLFVSNCMQAYKTLSLLQFISIRFT
jgi:hypothetical protein